MMRRAADHDKKQHKGKVDDHRDTSHHPSPPTQMNALTNSAKRYGCGEVKAKEGMN
jgi:hypothetical protein